MNWESNRTYDRCPHCKEDYGRVIIEPGWSMLDTIVARVVHIFSFRLVDYKNHNAKTVKALADYHDNKKPTRCESCKKTFFYSERIIRRARLREVD